MELSSTFKEDVLANALALGIMIAYVTCRDICKRVSHSTCKYNQDSGLIFALPTWREREEGEGDDGLV